MPCAALYARVSTLGQKEEETIASQTAELKEQARSAGLIVPPEWVFEDAECSGSTLIRPALERLRDLVVQERVDVILCHAPDRLARRYACQVLLMEEFERAGTEVRFLKAPPTATSARDRTDRRATRSSNTTHGSCGSCSGDTRRDGPRRAHWGGG